MAALPNTGINVTLVAKTLGHPASTKVGQLCTHPNINMWSRWKPVRHPKTEGLTDYDLQGVRSGIVTGEAFDNVLSVITRYRDQGDEGVFEYLRPTGGADSPFRLGDFRNYSHDESIFYALSADGGTLNVSINPVFRVTMQTNVRTFTNMTFDDIGCGNRNLAVAIVPQGSLALAKFDYLPYDLMHAGTGMEYNLDINISDLDDGVTYEVFAFLRESIVEDEEETLHYFALENGILGTLSVIRTFYTTSATGSIILNAQQTYDASFTVQVSTHGLTETTEIYGADVSLRYANSDPASQLRPGEESIGLEVEASLSPGGSWQFNVNFGSALQNLGANGREAYIYVTFASNPQIPPFRSQNFKPDVEFED